MTVKGPKGTLSHTVVEPITVERDDDGTVVVKRPDDERRSKAMHGLSRIAASTTWSSASPRATRRSWRSSASATASRSGRRTLEFALGFSHPVVVTPPDGITFAVETPTRFSVAGIDKQLVGEAAANIRKLRKPEPVQGQGRALRGRGRPPQGREDG